MTIDQPDPPQMTSVDRQLIYWEDVEVGPVMEYGSITVTRDAIIDFARRFDPQAYHVDEAAARAHRFGGLVASGLHTSSMCMRLLVDNLLGKAASLGSPGVRRIRWPRPVRPGDVLRVRQRVVSKRRSRTRPDVGLLDSELVLVNQHGEPVMEWDATLLFRLRHPNINRP